MSYYPQGKSILFKYVHKNIYLNYYSPNVEEMYLNDFKEKQDASAPMMIIT